MGIDVFYKYIVVPSSRVVIRVAGGPQTDSSSLPMFIAPSGVGTYALSCSQFGCGQSSPGVLAQPRLRASCFRRVIRVLIDPKGDTHLVINKRPYAIGNQDVLLSGKIDTSV